jgi:hypothetical protein
MRVDDRDKVTNAAASPAVRKVSGARQHPATIADNAKALGSLFSRLAGSRDVKSKLFARLADSRDAHKATARALGLGDAR